LSFKKEVEKLIREEQKRLFSERRKNVDFWKGQRRRFRAMGEILGGLEKSLGKEYVRINIYSESAWVEVGRNKDLYFSIDVCFRVEPDFEGSEDGLYQRPGFRVVISPPAPGDDKTGKVIRLANEQEVAEYLKRRIEERLAHYQSAELSPRRENT
jgi:hypothetical protein